MAVNEQATFSPRRQRWTIVIASIASFMVGLDVLVLMTALPTLRQEFHADAAGLGWTINAYEIGFAALILTGAALGDRYGRRSLFVIGVAVFTVGSILCAVSSSIEMLILARGFQGLGGGVATALALAVISAATKPEQRGAAFGIWGAVTGMAVALGPLTGGAIVHVLNWHWIFWVNVPIGIVLIGLSMTRIADTKGDAVRIDIVGLILSTAGVVALAQALLRGGDTGWTEPSILAGLAGGFLALAVFVLWEHRTSQPIMPLSMFRNRSFTGGCGVSFALGASLYGQAFLLAQYFQVALGQDALGVGVRLLPWVAMTPVVAPIAGQVADRIGERPIVITGLVLFAAGSIAIAPLVNSGASYGKIVLPLIVAGIGVTMTFTTVVSALMRSVEPARFGMASGVGNTVRQVGAVFGVAVSVAVFTTFGGFGSPDQFIDGFVPAVIVLSAITLAGVLPALVISPPAATAPPVPAPDTRAGTA